MRLRRSRLSTHLLQYSICFLKLGAIAQALLWPQPTSPVVLKAEHTLYSCLGASVRRQRCQFAPDSILKSTPRIGPNGNTNHTASGRVVCARYSNRCRGSLHSSAPASFAGREKCVSCTGREFRGVVAPIKQRQILFSCASNVIFYDTPSFISIASTEQSCANADSLDSSSLVTTTNVSELGPDRPYRRSQHDYLF